MQYTKNISPAKKRIFIIIFTLIFTLGFIRPISSSADYSYKEWKQFDSSWSSMTLGGSATMARTGCAVTSLAMLCVHSGAVSDESFNPGVLVSFLNKDGAFTGDGSITWSKITDYTPYLTYEKSKTARFSSESAAVDAMKDYLLSGYYVIIKVNNSGSTHFVTLDYITSDKIYMMDPGKTGATDLFGTYGYGNIREVRLFKSAIGDPSTLITDGTVPEDPVITIEEATEPADSVSSTANVVLNTSGDVISSNTSDFLAGSYKTIAPLNLRSDSNIDSDVLWTIPRNTEVNVEVTTLDGWGMVTWNGKTGWVSLRYVE